MITIHGKQRHVPTSTQKHSAGGVPIETNTADHLISICILAFPNRLSGYQCLYECVYIYIYSTAVQHQGLEPDISLEPYNSVKSTDKRCVRNIVDSTVKLFIYTSKKHKETKTQKARKTWDIISILSSFHPFSFSNPLLI